MVTQGDLVVRREQASLLIRPATRTIRWASFAAVGLMGALVVWTGGRKGGDPATVALPVATTLLCVWLGFLFEDLVAETTASSATPLLFRRAVRVAIAAPAIGALWFAYTWIGPLDGPTAAMLGSFCAEIAITLAVAAVAVRAVGPPRSGLVAAAAVVLVIVVLPVSLGDPPSVDPSSPPFGEPLTYWTALAVAGCAVLALVHLDPVQRA